MTNRKYIVENPRGISKKHPVIRLGSGRELRAGDVVTSAELSDIAEDSYGEHGFIRPAKRGEG